LPQGKDVRFELQSADVNHSFYVPAFRTKEDCIPGRTNHMWFHTTNIGVYDIECAEYCGMNHSYMLGKVKVVPEKEFLEWVNKIDSVKKTDSLTTGSIKTDSIKTTEVKTTDIKTDSSKTTGNKKDTLKVNPKDTVKRKEK
jgi:cytochrome c oxidase subunit 2